MSRRRVQLWLARPDRSADKRDMDTTTTNTTTSPTRGTTLAHRIVAGIVLGIAFVVMGSIFTPASIHADHAEHGQHDPNSEQLRPHAMPTPLAAPAPADRHDDSASQPPVHALGDVAFSSAADLEHLPLLGTFEGVSHRIEVYGSPRGPLYTIFDCSADRVVAQLIDRARVEQFFPEVPMPELAAMESASAFRLDDAWVDGD